MRVLEKAHWQKQFRDVELPLQFQFDSLGRVVKPLNPRGFRQAGGSKQKVLVDGPKEVVHENPYATLDHPSATSMASVFLKEQVHR